MSKRKIIFRADGNSNIGLGHVVRSLALAEMLKGNFNCTFAIQSPSDYLKKEITRICDELYVLPESQDHFHVFLELLQGNEIVVLDNYYYDTAYQHQIKAKGCALVCIDDLHEYPFVADMIINHSEGIRPSQYDVSKDCKLLLGYSYCLLRTSFLKSARQNSIKAQEKISNLLISIGGADPLGLTNFFVGEVIDVYEIENISIIIGGANTTFDKSLQKLKNITVYKNLNALEVSTLMRDCDGAVLPASTTAIEACATRLPFITGYYVDNQTFMYEQLVKKGLALGSHDWRFLDKDLMRNKLLELQSATKRIEMSLNQVNILDGRSDSRLLQHFIELEENMPTLVAGN